MTKAIVSEDRIIDAIITVRGQRVMLASDLAALYGTSTKRLNEQVKRNRERFPRDLCFKLNPFERDEVVANCDHLRGLKFSPSLPLAFTEHGVIMAANVLNTTRAVEVSLHVVRAFMNLRNFVATHRQLVRKIDVLERRYDGQFKVVFDALRELMKEPAKLPIGFR